MKTSDIKELISTSLRAFRQERQELDRHHAWYLGEFWDYEGDLHRSEAQNTDGAIDDGSELEVNYPYAFIDTMIANVCPTNPQLTVSARHPDYTDVARARERLANDSMRRDKLYEKAWQVAATTAIAGRGITKTVWRDDRRRPCTIIIDPRNFFWDRTVPFEDSSFVCEAVVLKESDFESMTKPTVAEDGTELPPFYNKDVASRASASAYPEWMSRGYERHDFGHLSKHARDVFRWIVVYEFYDLESRKYYHMLQDVQEPLFEGDLPFDYMDHPYDLVVFNHNLRDSGGISDIKLIRSPQARLNEIDSLELEHTFKSIPVAMVNTALLDDAKSFKAAMASVNAPGAYVDVQMQNNTIPLEAVLQYSKTPALSPSFDKMRDRTTGVIEFTLGIPQYSRGQVGGSEIATEVALADTATRTRNGRRIKVMESWVASVGKKCVAMTAQFAQDATEFAVLDKSSRRAELLSAAELEFDNQASFDDDWEEYDAVPYSPTENHRLVTLQQLQTYMPVLVGNPNVDQGKLMMRLLDLLGMSELHKDEAPPPGPAGMMAAGPMGPGAEMGGAVDPTQMLGNGGEMPPDLEQVSQAVAPPEAMQMAQPPVM